MKLTIIVSDGAVYKDSYSYSGLILEGVPDTVHALQWDNGAGWLEFKSESEFRRPPNEVITELPSWALDAVNKWDAEKAAEEAAIVESEQQPISQGAQTL